VENQNYSGHRLNVWLGRVSITTSQTARPLLTPGEVLQLPKDKEIIFVGGCPPILAGLVFYYRDKNFISRLREAPVNSDVLIYKPKDNLLVSEFSLDTAFPGADVHKIRKMPEYKDYFPRDEKEIEEIKNYAAGKAQISSSEQIPFAEEY
jgi:type IV secretory pathway TraG/TraD family ATPase VirD4